MEDDKPLTAPPLPFLGLFFEFDFFLATKSLALPRNDCSSTMCNKSLLLPYFGARRGWHSGRAGNNAISGIIKSPLCEALRCIAAGALFGFIASERSIAVRPAVVVDLESLLMLDVGACTCGAGASYCGTSLIARGRVGVFVSRDGDGDGDRELISPQGRGSRCMSSLACWGVSNIALQLPHHCKPWWARTLEKASMTLRKLVPLLPALRTSLHFPNSAVSSEQ